MRGSALASLRRRLASSANRRRRCIPRSGWADGSRAAAPARERPRRRQSLLEGALLVGGGVALSAALARRGGCAVRARAVARCGRSMRGLALKPALSLAPLVAAATEVQTALQRGHLVEARRLLGWHLVSRDTTRPLARRGRRRGDRVGRGEPERQRRRAADRLSRWRSRRRVRVSHASIPPTRCSAITRRSSSGSARRRRAPTTSRTFFRRA